MDNFTIELKFREGELVFGLNHRHGKFCNKTFVTKTFVFSSLNASDTEMREAKHFLAFRLKIVDCNSLLDRYKEAVQPDVSRM